MIRIPHVSLAGLRGPSVARGGLCTDEQERNVPKDSVVGIFTSGTWTRAGLIWKGTLQPPTWNFPLAFLDVFLWSFGEHHFPIIKFLLFHLFLKDFIFG